jgi:hypothetical protein
MNRMFGFGEGVTGAVAGAGSGIAEAGAFGRTALVRKARMRMAAARLA